MIVLTLSRFEKGMKLPSALRSSGWVLPLTALWYRARDLSVCESCCQLVAMKLTDAMSFCMSW